MTQESIDHTSMQYSLNQIVLEYLKDNNRKRRWRWVKRAGFGLVILAVIFLLYHNNAQDALERAKPHVGIIDIKGEIADGQLASADTLMKGLNNAYQDSGLRALIFRIDSPGGSPVQADYMFNTIQYFKKKYPKIKTYAVCMDACASAAYYVAASTDYIYASPSSLVGSIGVLYNGFGFVDAMQKVGVSRRLFTAGTNKGFMDQFSPVNPQQQNLQTMLDLIHKQFIQQVKLGRGNRLKIDNNTFSGMVWTGLQAKDQGLIDGFASAGQLARDIIKIEASVDYTEKHNVLDQFAQRFGASMVDELPKAFGLNSSVKM